MAGAKPFVALIFACWAAAGGALAQTKVSRELPALLVADTVTYDQELGVVTAQGHVEISQGERTVFADTVTYYEKDGRVIATGNVSLIEPSGDVLFANYVELTDEMRNGFVDGARIRLSDDSRLAANSAERVDGNRMVMERAIYSPCNLCPSDPTRAPLWQLKSVQVVHNQAAQRIEYKDAFLETFGVPVLYSPYFSHPDPTTKRQSGFLTPSLSTNLFFGLRGQVPYYWVIAPEKDATITPQVSAKQGLHLAGEYRQRTIGGEYKIDASGTSVDEIDAQGRLTGDSEWRGHFRGIGRFRFDDEHAWGFNIFRTTDNTYLRRYGIDGNQVNTLVSRLYVEGIQGRTYSAANAYAFQGLRSDDDPGSTPIVLPMLDYSFTGEPATLGGRFGLDANLLSLYRTDGTDVRRLSLTGSWTRPYYAPAGDVYTFTAQMRGDGYWINEGLDPANPQGAEESVVTGRFRPLAALDWRFPFLRPGETWSQLIEPIASVVVTPYGGNPDAIPNEDSRSFEFDDTNLFSLSRFPGLDRYDGGPRFNYGLRLGLFAQDGRYGEFLVGQSLRAKEEDIFSRNSGLVNQQSDYVARATLGVSNYFYLSDRIRLDQDSLTLRRHEILASVGPQALRLSLSYALLDRALFTDELLDREAASLTLFAQLTKYWSMAGSHSRDLATDGRSLLTYYGLRYTDECFDVLFYGERNFTVNRDLQPATTFGVRFRLFTLG